MKKIRGVYVLLVLVITALIVLSGTWIPEALLDRKAQQISSGEAAVVGNQEVTPYMYTMSVGTRISALAEMVTSLWSGNLEQGIDVREPLDTELTQQQAQEKAEQFLNSMQECMEERGLETLAIPITDAYVKSYAYAADKSTQEYVTSVQEGAGAATQDAAFDSTESADTAAYSVRDSFIQDMAAVFLVDPSDQQMSVWMCYINTYDNTITMALDAVTGIPVWVQCSIINAASEEYAAAFADVYARLYGENCTFEAPDPTDTLGVGIPQSDKWTAYICQGEELQLEYQYFIYTDAKAYDAIYGTAEVWLH